MSDSMTLQDYAKRINDNARAHGFWDEDRNFGEMIALMHSELSEALEAHREGELPYYIEDFKPEGVAVELADCLIRILDTLYSLPLDLDIDDIVLNKMRYNEGRPFKHGKAY